MKEMKIPSVARQVMEARKRKKEIIKTKIGEVVDRRGVGSGCQTHPRGPEYPIDKSAQQGQADQGPYMTGFVRQSCSLRRKMGNKATVEIKVRMAAKLRGETLGRAILAMR